MKMPRKDECKHLNARIMGSNPIMKATCPECYQTVYISEVLNNWLDELAKVREDQLAYSKEIRRLIGRTSELVREMEERVKI